MAEDKEEKVFEKLKGNYKHYCPDWDFMAIDETCPEYEACTCSIENWAVTMKQGKDHEA
jgi:hypothetical protein